MADEPKDQKSSPLEPPKDIENILKELPRVDVPKPPVPPSFPKPPPSPSSPQSPMPPKSQTPPPPKPLTLPPLPPKPSASPAPPPQKPLSPDDKFKSLVRTMNEDLEAAKKGQKPEPKPFEIKPPPGGPKFVPPLPQPPTIRPPSPEIKLGPAERTKMLETPKGPPAFPPAGPLPKRKPTINPKLLILIVVILAAFGGIWFFITRETEEVVIFTPTPTPTPTFPGLSQIFRDTYPVTIASTDNFVVSFNNLIKNVSPLSFGGFTAVSVINEDGELYSLSEIFQKLQIDTPDGLLESLDANEWFLVAYGQQETFDSAGGLTFNQVPEIKLGIVAKITRTSTLQSTLNSWEITMTNDLKNLFGINSQEASSEIFLDNIYRGADIRYRNFPYADSTIDYTIINLPEFNLDYFVLTNSRETIYSAIDLLQAQ